MNGAESLVRTLVGGGVEVCFVNPGTSEMHFVAALDAAHVWSPTAANFMGFDPNGEIFEAKYSHP